ncbi:tRNA 2-thiouridine(34) synthase MnmA, partial [Candidatus Saccharibacteria bacterium]|nr:tRNA 2-thiouridine(34) synthase MnmA [Candidatus Saccharibacteria bacterium]
MKTVYIGMSGGVDSSLSAVLLKDQGYHVVGVYMKNWSRDLPGMKCPWAADLADAKRVAVRLGIDFKVFDFETEYKQKVVDYMLEEFGKGHTPNPDIMCNQEIKFKLFYETAREQGADLIATGHYARVWNDEVARLKELGSPLAGAAPEQPAPSLLRAVDENKDQTYFLYRISEDAIAHTLFPIGGMLKPDVKKLASEKGLKNAYKKESMGVCFVGEVGMEDFLKEYFPEKAGPVVDLDSGKEIGTHNGAIFYCLGQRHGLDLGGGLPYYVVKKDIVKNTIYVSRNLNSAELWTDELELEDVVMRNYRARGFVNNKRSECDNGYVEADEGKTFFSDILPANEKMYIPDDPDGFAR